FLNVGQFDQSTLCHLFKPHSVGRIPGGHVREDDLIAFVQAFGNFDGRDGAAAQLHLHAVGLVAVLRHLEELDLPLRLRAGGTADVEHVGELLDLDGALDGQVGAGTLGQFAFERDVDLDRALVGGGRDTGNRALDEPVAGVD